MGDFFKGKVIDGIWDACTSKAKDTYRNNELKKEIKEYCNTYFEESFYSIEKEAEVDFQGMVDYCKKALSGDFCRYFQEECNPKIRDGILDDILRDASNAAGADTEAKKITVYAFLKCLLVVIRKLDFESFDDETIRQINYAVDTTLNETNEMMDKLFELFIEEIDKRISQNPVKKPAFEVTIVRNTSIKPTKYFTGRETELKNLRDIINKQEKRILLSGMGGIGKTELCRKIYTEYIDMHANNKLVPIDHIGYITYENSMDRSLVNSMVIPEGLKEDEHVKWAWRHLADAFSDGKRGVLFVDNVSNTISEDESLKSLDNLHCSVIVTSRRKTMGEWEVFPIDKLDEKECRAIFLKLFLPNKEVEEKEYFYNYQLTEDEEKSLQNIIKTRAARHTLTVKLLAKTARSNDWSIAELESELESNGFDLSRIEDGDEKNLIDEYKKLFDLAKLSDAEINCLEAFSILPYSPLPKKTCIEWMSEDAGQGKKGLAIEQLRHKGWLEEQDSGLSMHPVISQTVQARQQIDIKNHSKLIENCTMTLANIDITEILNSPVPYWDFGNAILDYFYKNDFKTLTIASLAMPVASIYSDSGKYQMALDACSKALDIREKVLGKEHTHTLEIYNDISSVCVDQGNYTMAYEWGQKALNMYEKFHGKGNIGTANIYGNIAGAYALQGNYTKALEWYKKNLDISERVLGKHPVTATTYSNIAVVYVNQGDYSRALEWSGDESEFLYIDAPQNYRVDEHWSIDR